MDFKGFKKPDGSVATVPEELPHVTASDDGKFLRVDSGVWVAQNVPAAETNSFGSN